MTKNKKMPWLLFAGRFGGITGRPGDLMKNLETPSRQNRESWQVYIATPHGWDATPNSRGYPQLYEASNHLPGVPLDEERQCGANFLI